MLDALATRLTMPLAEFDVAAKVPTALCPLIVVKGQRYHALAHCAAPVPAKDRFQMPPTFGGRARVTLTGLILTFPAAGRASTDSAKWVVDDMPCRPRGPVVGPRRHPARHGAALKTITSSACRSRCLRRMPARSKAAA